MTAMPSPLWKTYSPHRTESAPADNRPTSETADRVGAELAAMRSVGEALEHVRDDETRARVLRWAAESFGLSTAPRVSPPAQPALSPSVAAVDVDPNLAVSELEWLFAEKLTLPDPTPTSSSDPGQPVVSMIHGFVADFQKLARDWHG